MNVSTLPALESLRCYTAAQTAITIVNTQPIIDLVANDNLLSSAEVDAILVVLDGNGLINGTVNLSGQTPAAPPSAAGLTAAANLTGKGWMVTVDLDLVIIDDGTANFWQLVVDEDGNIGAQSTVGPATTAIVLDDGTGTFWEIKVDVGGTRYTDTHAGPASYTPVLSDGGGGLWELEVDTDGNLGAHTI